MLLFAYTQLLLTMIIPKEVTDFPGCPYVLFEFFSMRIY